MVNLISNNFYTIFETNSSLGNSLEEIAKRLTSKDIPVETLNQLESDIKKSSKESNHESLLYRLIASGFSQAALSMIRSGVSTIHERNGFDSYTPLHLAAKKGDLDLVNALIESGADINAVDFPDKDITSQSTPLSCAIAKDRGYISPSHRQCFQLLLTHGSDPSKGYIIYTPILNWLILKRDFDLALFILDKADIHATDSVCKLTPLHHAALRGPIDLVKALIDRGSDVTALANVEGAFSPLEETPLHIAVRRNNPELIELLLQKKADPNLPAKNIFFGSNVTPELALPEPVTPFQSAVDRGNRECIDEILTFSNSNGIPLNTIFPENRTICTGTLEEMSRKGYLSIDLRLKTENARKKNSIPNLTTPPCYTLNESWNDLIYSAMTRRDFLAANAICSPLYTLFLEYSKKEENLGIYFLKPEELPNGRACYNGDTKSEIIVTLEENSDETGILHLLIHEITHFLADQIYPGSQCSPPDSSFFEKCKRDIEMLDQREKCHPFIKILCKAVGSYPENKQPGELLARLPQAAIKIALDNPSMTSKELDDILYQSIPNIYQFYQEVFLPQVHQSLTSELKTYVQEEN